MEKLEVTAKEAPLSTRDSEKTSPDAYEGLKLIDEAGYQDGTSIRYWM